METIYDISNRVRNKLEILTSKDGYRLSWPQLAERIDKQIDILGSLEVKKKRHYSQWTKIANGITDKRLNYFWWQELEKIIENILTEITNDDEIEVKDINIVTQTKENIKEPLIYDIAKFQDTIIPNFFKQSYTARGLKVHFDIEKDWNQVLDSFATNNTQVSLHNFSTAIALAHNVDTTDGVFFFPFFIFKGYGIFIKVDALNKFCEKKGIKNSTFKKLRNVDKIEFLESAKVVMETKTDVEWVYKTFCRNLKANWNYIKENNILDNDINEGKKIFKNNKSAIVYCTNSIHITDLSKYKNKYELIENGDLVNHQNMNGLVCKMSYFNRNPLKIKILIDTWFHTINEFIEGKEEILSKQEDYKIKNHHLNSMLHRLKEFTDSQITLFELMQSYRNNNVFYTEQNKAFTSFYTTNFVDQQISNNDYLEIANTQLGDEKINKDLYKKIVVNIYNNMQDVLQKIKEK